MNQVPKSDRAEVRQAVSAARLRRARLESRVHAFNRLGGQIVWCGFATLVILIIAYAFFIDPPGPKPRPVTHVNWVVETPADLCMLAALAGLVGLTLLPGSRWRYTIPDVDAPVRIRIRLRERFDVRTNITLIALAVAGTGGLLGVTHFGLGGTLSRGGDYALGGAAALAWFAGKERVLRAICARKEVQRPTDHIVLSLAGPVAHMRRLRTVWWRPDVSRYLLERLERAAQEIETGPDSNPTPLAQWRLRAVVRQHRYQVAELVRAHKAPIATAHSQAAYDRVLASLTTGLVAAAREDWDALLEHGDQNATQVWYQTYFAKNLVPAVTLGAAAVALGWLPAFRANPASELGLRLTLGVYAVLRLLPGASLTDLVDRGLTRGFTGLKEK